MDLDLRRTGITINALAKSVEDLETRNEELWTQNLSTMKMNEELVTKRRDCVPTYRGRAKKYTLLASLPRKLYGFTTDLEKIIITWVRKEVSELKTDSEVVAGEWKGRSHSLEDRQQASNGHRDVVDLSPTLVANAPAYFVPSICGE